MAWTEETKSLSKRLAALGILVAALIVAIKVDPAAAAPCREFTTDYYEEPELINWCGFKYNACSQIFREGCQTEWYTVEFGDCCGGGGGPLCDC